MKNKLLTLIVIMLCNTIAFAQPTQPILRIETGMHRSACRKIATDATGRRLLTCSDDKTAKLWDAETGELLHTLRIPIGPGIEGKISACVLSANGSIAIVGGHTGYSWGHCYCFYILNAQTGEMIARIKGLPSQISDFAFSADGNWLAVSLHSNMDSIGVYIINTKSWIIEQKLRGFPFGANTLTFAWNGQLATASDYGKIRIYDTKWNTVAEKICFAGKKPESLAFNPRGANLAIAFGDTTTIGVLRTKDLSVDYLPDVTLPGNIGKNLRVVNFSYDGKRLWGGGYCFTRNSYVLIRKWDSGGRGAFMDIPLMADAIFDIKPLPNGNLAVLGYGSEVAVVDSDGKTIWYNESENNSYRALDKSHFRLSSTGWKIGFTPGGGAAITFAADSRGLDNTVAMFPAPTDTCKGTVVSGWHEGTNPVINHHRVNCLHEGETCHAVDISNDGTKVVLGSNW